MKNHRIAAQRGISLIEALIALLVTTIALLGAAQFQQRVRALGDVSRERSEATRLADAEIERARVFIDAATATTLGNRDDLRTGAASTAQFTLERRVADTAAGARDLSIGVRWSDRTGAPQRIEFATFVAPHDPRLSGALMLAAAADRTAPGAPAAFARHAAVPREARDLGDGRSAWTPGASPITWIFDNTSGAITSRCTSGTTGCTGMPAVAVSGTVRFDASATPDAGRANDAPLPLTMAIAGAPAHACHAMPATVDADRFVRYVCIVELEPAWAWSGRIEVVPAGWTLGASDADRRVCRYAAVAPERHNGVGVSITHQDFLVVRGDVACPSPAPSAAILAATVDRRTLAHQP